MGQIGVESGNISVGVVLEAELNRSVPYGLCGSGVCMRMDFFVLFL